MSKNNNLTDSCVLSGLTFTQKELWHFIHFITNDETISKFLKYDQCYRLADNYLLASAFIYFKRSGVTIEEYSHVGFFAALLLAHAMVEENDEFIDEIMEWALPDCADDNELVRQLHTVKFLMFQSMGCRGLISRASCNIVMSAMSHPIWSRNRDAVHGGTHRSLSKCLLKGNEAIINWETGSCEKCRKARRTLFGCSN